MSQSDRCGKPAAPFIPRWGMAFACVLPKRHEGECRRGGTCSKHGDYVGDKCPKFDEDVAAFTDQADADIERSRELVKSFSQRHHIVFEPGVFPHELKCICGITIKAINRDSMFWMFSTHCYDVGLKDSQRLQQQARDEAEGGLFNRFFESAEHDYHADVPTKVCTPESLLLTVAVAVAAKARDEEREPVYQMVEKYGGDLDRMSGHTCPGDVPCAECEHEAGRFPELQVDERIHRLEAALQEIHELARRKEQAPDVRFYVIARKCEEALR